MAAPGPSRCLPCRSCDVIRQRFDFPPGVQADQLGRLALTFLASLYPADSLSGEEVALLLSLLPLHHLPAWRTPPGLLFDRAAPGLLQARGQSEASDLTVQDVLAVITEVRVTETGEDGA